MRTSNYKSINIYEIEIFTTGEEIYLEAEIN